MADMEQVSPVLNMSSTSTQTNMNSSSHCDQDPVDSSASLFFIVVYSLVFLVGLLLNGFTLKFYFCSAQQQATSSVTVYLKNLAAADFLISLCLPIRISHFSSRSITIFRVYCNFGANAFYLNMYASILFMGYIAANRYLKIVHPLGNNVLQTVRSARVISTVTWAFLLALVTAFATMMLLSDESPPSVTNTLSCDVLLGEKISLFYKALLFCSSTIFLIVFVSLFLFYCRTSRKLATAEQRQRAPSGSKKLAKSRRNMLVLVVVFCVCFVPYHLARLPYTFLKRRGQTFFYLKEMTVLMSTLNVCLDPLLYFIFCKAYRAQLKKSVWRGSQRAG